ncbi:MAG: rhomboid family intramembrane serine protease [Bdellovibrio sp. CG10_big_fil_rev_8_21_14_0_10_47_8]|nr:MAG: rhomboid family intramembrane serine protease [Bdellovibrio sp. CG10_big_fil_rev_8_21_14_0_10_47_8]
MNFSISKTVKWLVIINIAVWLGFQIILEQYVGVSFSRWFALYPAKFLYDFFLWQPLTYMFLHTYQPTHIFFNMLMLWFLGTELENRWGRKFFLSYYLISGAGAGLIYCIGTWIYFLLKPGTTALVIPVMGASGAIFGLLLAYGIIFGERMIYVMGVFPMKAKFFVLIMGLVELSSLLTSDVNGGDVAYLAHLGGLVSGYLTLVAWTRIQRSMWSQKAKKRNRNLRLVVDNEKQPKTGEGPKYWN